MKEVKEVVVPSASEMVEDTSDEEELQKDKQVGVSPVLEASAPPLLKACQVESW